MKQNIFSRDQMWVLFTAGALFVCGFALVAFHSAYEGGSFPSIPTQTSDGSVLYVLASSSGELGTSLFVTGIFLLFFELVLRRRELEEIREVIEVTSNSREVREVFPRRHQVEGLIESDIVNCKRNDRFDLIGTSERVLFAEHPGYEELAACVRRGAHFRILILHPDSTLLGCIEAVSKDFGFPDVKLSLRETARGRIARLCQELDRDAFAGSLEIRMHRDVYSTLAYFHSPRLTILGVYFSHESGTQCPALSLAKAEVANASGQHFEKLWSLSEFGVLVQYAGASRLSNIDAVFPVSANTQ